MSAEAATIHVSSTCHHASQAGDAQPLSLQLDLDPVLLPVRDKPRQRETHHFRLGRGVEIGRSFGPGGAGETFTVEQHPVANAGSGQQQGHRIALFDE